MAVKVEERKRNFIVNTINHLVRTSKFPVASTTLVSAGVTTRKELRKLHRDGVLKECQVTAGGVLLNAYYTEGAVPDVIIKRDAELAQQESSEGEESNEADNKGESGETEDRHTDASEVRS